LAVIVTVVASTEATPRPVNDAATGEQVSRGAGERGEPMTMHPGQVDLSADTVAGLVAAQFPAWRGLAVRPVRSTGTVNALFGLGDDLVLRFPLRPSRDPAARAELAAEQDHARWFGGRLPVAVPEPVALGRPGPGYAGPWSVYRWIPGETADGDTVGDWERFARDLAAVVVALRQRPTAGRRWDGTNRGGPLADADAEVRAALVESAPLVDTAALARVWEQCLAAPPADDGQVWLHGDLMPGNLLVRDGRLVAVIDFGLVGIGDPAVDLMPAWNLLPAPTRASFRTGVGADDATWERGRGWALVQAIMALPYYVDTNPALAATARHTLDALLDPS
jgi:aminoglycoside phosphotransferase (APT) family kinase protein